MSLPDTGRLPTVDDGGRDHTWAIPYGTTHNVMAQYGLKYDAKYRVNTYIQGARVACYVYTVLMPTEYTFILLATSGVGYGTDGGCG